MAPAAATPDYPSYAANRAWSITDSLLRTQLSYCETPSAKDDLLHDLSDLVDQIGDSLRALASVQSLMTSAYDATPAPELLSAIRAALKTAESVQVHTWIKFVHDTESEIGRARTALGAARAST